MSPPTSYADSNIYQGGGNKNAREIFFLYFHETFYLFDLYGDEINATRLRAIDNVEFDNNVSKKYENKIITT